MVPQLSLVRENPLFTDAHQTLSKNIEDFVSREIEPRSSEHPDTEHQFREYLSILSAADLLKYSVAQADRPLDVRSLCIVREALSFSSSLADLVFVMQGLGTYCLALAAPEHIREFWIPRALSGKAIAAFALTEPMAGSEIAGIQTLAVREGESYILNGTKRFITNAGIADFYTIFARTGESEEQRPIISAFVAGSRMPGLQVTERIEMISPHPIGEIQLNSMRIPAENLIGKEGDGHKLALETLDIFRVSVGAAACGMMSRALRESIRYATERKQFGVPIAQHQLIQEKLADMATDLDAARLLVYNAAYVKDTHMDQPSRLTNEAKLFATEAASRVIDKAVQIHGGAGLVRGTVIERLYRDVRALRIYEGTSEIQKIVIANKLIQEAEQ